jgi:hypothetical protein
MNRNGGLAQAGATPLAAQLGFHPSARAARSVVLVQSPLAGIASIAAPSGCSPDRLWISPQAVTRMRNRRAR